MKTKKLYGLTITIIGLCILIGIGGVVLYTSKQESNYVGANVSKSQISADSPKLTSNEDDEYFELMGFGQLEINEQYPNLNMINPSENKVYLSFDVIYNDNVLYSTELIEPGMMEQFDIYSCLDAGEHTITYSIDVYDIDNMDPLWNGIKQEQEIIIKK